MMFEEKIIASVFMFIFSAVVWLTSHKKYIRGYPSTLEERWRRTQLFYFLFNKDGTEKKYTKLIVSLFFFSWGISFWLFPDIWK